jgi:hypothetical protein
MPSLRTKLFRYPGPGGWHFVTVPRKHAPAPTESWGRTPARATVDGAKWVEQGVQYTESLPKK